MSSAFLTQANENTPGPVIASVNINSCVGSITISVTSGQAPYTYLWQDSGGTILPSTTFVADNLVADNYTVTVTDNNGDFVTATYTVTNPPDLVGTVVVNNVTCRGDSDAQVIVTMTNGNPGYDWVLNNSGGGQVGTGSVAFPSNVITIGGLGVDTYTLDVTDQDGCTGQIIFTITEPANFLGVNLVNQTNATCSNLANGSLEVVGTGGWGGYSYLWIRVADASTAGTTAAISGLLPGDYTVYVTDANGCIVTQTYTITSPAPITTTSTLTQVSCNGFSDGAIDITVTGGNGGYTYNWSNGATTEDISGLAAGNYSVTITDGLGCIYNENFTITEPAVLTINENIRDVACFGDNTGRIRSNVSGGTAPYTYLWSTGHTGRNLNNRVAGNYSLTVTDANGCTTFENFTIAEPAMALSVQNIVHNLPSCFGGNDGSLVMTMQGGTAPYSYNWSSGSTSNSSGSVTAGIYSVTVTDANGCAITENYTLNDPIRISVAPTLTLPTCNGGNDGSITVVASNGTAPYSYNWNTGDVGPTVNTLAAGSYQVTVTDASGCSVVESITLGEPTPISGNSVVNNISCNGQVDGSIFLAATGGTGPYTYLWNTGATTSNISGLAAGNYSVTITDASGCGKFEAFTVVEPAAIQATFTKTDVLCKGNTTGAIDLSPSGGTAPYTFLWSNGSTTEDLNSLAAGNYSVTVRDASNCTVVVNVTINEPAVVLDVSGVVTHVSCNGGNNGSIKVNTTGGIAPYTFLWNNGATTEDLTNVPAGNYSLQVTDANGCVKPFGFTINEPTPLAVSTTVTQITCHNADDGTINLTVSGGTAPYSYSWNDGNTNQNRSSLSPGNYAVTVTDANGCQNIQNFNITEPLPLTTTLSKQDVLCFGQSTGIVSLTPSGGTAPYSFVWSNGAITEDLNNVPAGSYSVVITDANGCSINANTDILEPAAALSMTDVVSQITCNAANDGAIALTITGGTAPYSFNWSNGSTNQNLSGLSSGNYSVTITDANGCTLNANYAITDPPVLVATGIASDVTCFGAANGSIDLTVAGGEAPYTFIWSHGANTEDVSNLPPSTYTVQVVDSRGCSVSENFVIDGPTALNLSYTKVDVDCFGNNTGSTDITVTGGTAPYTYSWSNGSTTEDLNNLVAGLYTVTVTDANGCQLIENINVDQPTGPLTISETVTDISCFGVSNGSVELVVSGGTAPYSYSWSTGATTKDIFGLIVGNYSVTVTDANGCSTSGNYTINSPAALQLTSSITDLTCNGAGNGAIDINIVGGTLPYTFLWSDGSTTEDLSNIPAGNYQVLATDANGCTLSRSFTVAQPLVLSISSNVSNVTCFGVSDGSIDVDINGGNAPYTYLWSNGAVTEDLFNISGGTYTLTVTDVNGCVQVETISVFEPSSSLNASAVVSNETCSGLANGLIDLSVSGGVAPYTYQWNTGQTTQDISGLSQGTYQVTISDSNGCNASVSFDVSGPQPITLSGVGTNLTCFQSNDGALDLIVAGGTAPYSYSWSNGATSEDISGLSTGNYTVTVTDANGCAATGSFSIVQPLPLTISHSSKDVTCFGVTDGSIDLTISGGTGPYQYAWSNGAITQDLINIAGGTYVVNVTDQQGCTVSQTINIAAPTQSITVVADITDATCFGQASGQLSLSVTGGTAPYNYQWNNGSSQANLVNVLAGDYIVEITDSQGCTFTGNYTIQEPDLIDATFDVLNTTCFGDTDGSIIAEASGGVGPYTYVWSNGSTSKDQFNLTGGTYNVTITDAQGCSVTKSVVVGDSRSLVVEVIKTDVLCKGESSAAILLDVTGGSGNYTYLWNTGDTSPNISALPAGVYTATITDSGGCATTTSVIISEPSLALSADLTKTDHISCYGESSGFASANVVGGVAPYTFLWSTGERTASISNLSAGDYSLAITDANGCLVQQNFSITQPEDPIEISVLGNTDLRCNGLNDGSIQLSVRGGTAPYTYLWSTGSTEGDITGLNAGDYTVRVTDAIGCVSEKIISVVQPEELRIANVNIRQSLCFDDRNGAIELDIEGGTLPYTYQWSTGAITKNIIGIPSGTYDLTVTDARGCEVQASYTLHDPALFKMNPDLLHVTCVGANDGLISLNIEGIIEPISIRWNTGASSETITNLSPGTYNVIVTNGNGCTIQQDFVIIEPLPLTLDAYIEDAVRCGDPKSGMINMIVSGGTEPYTYHWSNGASTSSLEDILPGTYVVTVTDGNGCTATGTYSVQQPEPLQIGLRTQVIVDCATREVSSLVSADVVGGTGAYAYEWNIGNSKSKEIYLKEPARVTLVVSDGLGCRQTRSIDVRIPELAEADFYYNSVAIDRTGELAANEPVNFFDQSIGEAIDWHWDFGDGFDSNEVDPIHTFDAPGTYNVVLTVQDASGCTSFKSQVLEITEGYRIMLPNAFTPNGDGNNDFFRPKMLGLKKAQFLVFNTWGEVIFSTDDPDSKGWNGKIKGKDAENGNYIFKVIGISHNGLRVETDGVFALIR